MTIVNETIQMQTKFVQVFSINMQKIIKLIEKYAMDLER